MYSISRSPAMRRWSFLWQESHVGSPLNDWADAMADVAREHDIVGAFNMAPSRDASGAEGRGVEVGEGVV
eukprot:6892341-Prymnesium_polylepis.1